MPKFAQTRFFGPILAKIARDNWRQESPDTFVSAGIFFAGFAARDARRWDLDFEGLMIETHPNPDEAWSDAAQQVTADGLETILGSLILRSQEVGADVLTLLEDMRKEISMLDDRMFDLLRDRMAMSEEVGRLKRENNITILQQDHWTKVIASRIDQRGDYRLTRHFVRQLMDAIHQESIRHQTKVMNPESFNKPNE